MTDTSQSTVGVRSRRQLVAEGAALGTAGVAGCMDEDEAGPQTGEPTASATQARTTEGTQPQQRGDVNLQAVQAAADGMVVPTASGLGIGDAINPEDTDTPVQDAVDLIKANERGLDRGVVYLPQGTIEEKDSIENLGSITIRGFGPSASKIAFPTQTDGVVVDENSSNAQLYQLQLKGPGANQNTGSALLFPGGGGSPFGFSMDQVMMVNWNDNVIHSKTKPYEMWWGKVHLWGNGGTQVQIDNWGPGNKWAVAKLNGGKNVDSLIDSSGGGIWSIGQINTGGEFTGEQPVYKFGHTGNGQVNIEHIHFEGTWPEDAEADAILDLSGPTNIMSIDSIGVPEYIVTVSSNDCFIGTVNRKERGITARVGVKGKNRNHVGRCVYLGSSTEVDNQSEGMVAVACLSDLKMA